MSDLTVEDARMHPENMVQYVVVRLQETLQQDQNQTEKPMSVQATVDHVANTVQITHQQLATQLQQMQLIMQTMQMNYIAVPHGTPRNYG